MQTQCVRCRKKMDTVHGYKFSETEYLCMVCYDRYKEERIAQGKKQQKSSLIQQFGGVAEQPGEPEATPDATPEVPPENEPADPVPVPAIEAAEPMITFSCTCGKKYKVRPKNAGKRLKCRRCGVILRVPAETAERLCPVCGSEIPPDAISCPRCDEVLEQQSGDDSPGSASLDALSYAGETRLRGRVRNPWAVIALNTITLTIYQLYWIYKLWDEAHNYGHGRNGAVIMKGRDALVRYYVFPQVIAVVFPFLGNVFFKATGRSTAVAFLVLAGVIVCCIFALARFLLLLFRTPGLVREMRRAAGKPEGFLGHPDRIALCWFIPLVGPLVFWGLTQSTMNRFWLEEAE